MVSNTLKISEKQTLKYPRSVAFIISNEFCERFNFYGMRTILVLYFTRRLAYDEDTATVLYHVFTSLVYFFPLIGAIIADSFLGRFKTILYLSVVYSIGTIVIAVGAVPPLNLPAKGVTILGLILIAVGTGGIKPCVSAFGGDQFKIPEQAKQLATFFSLFYFAINAGSLLSTSLTPILREDVHCFNENDCFSLAFGVPAALMIVSIIVFILGKKLYVIKEPSGNMIVAVSKCVTEALKTRSKEKNSAPRDHWLDYAEKKYGKNLVNDTKALLKILVLYLPLPVFWALFDQQGSRWTVQATRMIGSIGGFTIKPDQMQVINPLLILVFIPLFDYGLYPVLRKIGIKRPLQKLTTGGLLAAAAFILSGFVEVALEKTYPVVPKPNESQLRIFNGMPCDYSFATDIPDYKNFSVVSRKVFEKKDFIMSDPTTFNYVARSSDSVNCPEVNGVFNLKPSAAISYFITRDEDGVELVEYHDMPEKPKKGYPALRILSNIKDFGPVVLKNNEGEYEFFANDTDIKDIPEGKYNVLLHNKNLTVVNLQLGGVYTYIFEGDSVKGYKFEDHIIVEPNSMHMLWQLPQYIVITAGEVMFSVTGLEFSFTQAPSSMKSVLQACWLLAVAIGNMLVVLIAEFRIFESQAAEFFLFAALMIVDMIIFILLALRYTYVQNGDTSDGDDAEDMQVEKLPKSDKFDKIESQKTSKLNGHKNEGYEEEKDD